MERFFQPYIFPSPLSLAKNSKARQADLRPLNTKFSINAEFLQRKFHRRKVRRPNGSRRTPPKTRRLTHPPLNPPQSSSPPSSLQTQLTHPPLNPPRSSSPPSSLRTRRSRRRRNDLLDLQRMPQRRSFCQSRARNRRRKPSSLRRTRRDRFCTFICKYIVILFLHCSCKIITVLLLSWTFQSTERNDTPFSYHPLPYSI